MDRFLNLRVFTRLVDLGSFARTAEQLGLSPATATTHVAQLEAHLGVRLLNRNTRKLSVTDEGRTLYDRAIHILKEMQDLEDEFAGSDASLHGRLRVSAPPIVAAHILIPALPMFLQRHPQIRLELSTDTRFVDLVQEGIDCAIRVGTLPDSSLICRSLGSCAVGTCASPAYLAEHGEPETPDDLHLHACIGTFSSATGRPRAWVFENNGEKKIIECSGPLIFNSVEASAQASAMGMGIAQCMTIATREFVEKGKARLILRDWTPPGPPVQVVYPRSRFVTSRVRAFVEFALEIFPPRLVVDQTPPCRATKFAERRQKQRGYHASAPHANNVTAR